MPTRRLVHTRSISAQVFARDDGLWDVEAELVDTKGGDFRLATGTRLAGEPIHHMRLKVTIDTSLHVVEAGATSVSVPYPGSCETIAPDYRRLVGLNLMRNFRRDVRLLFGGTAGCTHITELTNVLPTAAIQAFAGEVIRTRDASEDDPAPGPDALLEQKPFQLDRCHALKSDGPAVAQFYPRWYRRAPDPSNDVPETKPVAERQT
ncbi:MAG: DUF2889 domain-containing protein [Burkholderiaceae bacterium]